MQHLDFSIQKPVLQRKKPFLHSFPPLSLFSSLCLSSFPWYPKPSSNDDPLLLFPPPVSYHCVDPLFQQKLSISFGFFLVPWPVKEPEYWSFRSVPDFNYTTVSPTSTESRLDSTRLDSTRLDPTRKKTLQRGNWAGCERKESKTDRRRKGDG